jgi:hypothetical protein
MLRQPTSTGQNPGKDASEASSVALDAQLQGKKLSTYASSCSSIFTPMLGPRPGAWCHPSDGSSKDSSFCVTPRAQTQSSDRFALHVQSRLGCSSKVHGRYRRTWTGVARGWKCCTGTATRAHQHKYPKRNLQHNLNACTAHSCACTCIVRTFTGSLMHTQAGRHTNIVCMHKRNHVSPTY